MRFSTAVASSSLLAFALAAPQLAAEVQDCIDACPAADVGCKATCVGVPNPNEAEAIANNDCAEECDQGDGSPAETEAFAACLARCADTFILTTGNAPAPTAGADEDDDETEIEIETETEVEVETETETEVEVETETDTELATETETELATETETEVVDPTDESG